MKQLRTLAIGLCLLLMPQAMLAQQNIKRALDSFIGNNKVQMKESHSKTRDPMTKQLVGTLDTYTFTIKAGDIKLIDELKSAIRSDSEEAYSEYWESAVSNDTDYKRRSVMYNDMESIAIGLQYANYVNVNFIDEANKEFRYAYAVEWNEPENDAVEGRIIISYARIPKKAKQKILEGFSIKPMGKNVENNSENWFMRFGLFRDNFMKNPKGVYANSYISHIYNLCKESGCLSDAEVSIVKDVIDEMISKTSDKMSRGMLEASIESLKKR
ncbi:MAG: hypothetical protein SOZ80_05245 [Prevotella sp.]|uniref:hypothetical protein n=1 Tax=Prevotella sp. TaxID=59823 RepID=UPI002A25D2A8|nr:hypothetical protein [Prevotella sp.]MDD7318483.1 hypothetical protein [Prevotellaceae bacterium]MDY4020166.1 hypothetical protein [Prevotella sp.]